MTKSEDNLDFLYYGDIWQALLGNKQHTISLKSETTSWDLCN